MKKLIYLILILFLLGCPKAQVPIVPPTPQAAVNLGPTEIWFGPDIGATDYLTIFSNPASWAQTRAKIKVFKFYPQLLVPSDACATCGPNKYPALVQTKVPSVMMPGGPTQVNPFQALLSWNIQIAIEAPAIKEWGCTASATMPYSQAAINTVNQTGAPVAWLMIDEALYAATTSVYLNPSTTQRCGMTFDQAVDEVNVYIGKMKAANPGIKVGSIEPYPIFDMETLVRWINATAIEAFHIDIDHDSPLPTLGPDLSAISAACKAKGIPFGVIFGGQEMQPGLDFLTGQAEFIQKVLQAYGTPPVSVFQSWQCNAGVCNTPSSLDLAQAVKNSTQ